MLGAAERNLLPRLKGSARMPIHSRTSCSKLCGTEWWGGCFWVPFSSQSCCGEVQHRGHCCEGAAWTVSQPQLLARCRNPSAHGLEPSQLVCSQLHHRSSEVSCSQLVEGTVSLRNLFVLWFPSAVGIILGAALQVSFGTHQGGKGGIAFLLSCYPQSWRRHRAAQPQCCSCLGTA